MCNTTDIASLSYRLMRIKGFGPGATNKLLCSIDTHLPYEDVLREISSRLNEKQKESFMQSFSMPEMIKGAECLTVLDADYPSQMKEELSTQTPPVVNYLGNLDLLKKKKVGFCGSRKVSEKGISITETCVQQLVEQDVCIVSGYAEGVDKTAHIAALKNGGTTILVLPEGINGFAIKKEYEAVWDWNRVLVLSEFHPSDPWLAGRAMTRNSTILALSDAIVIIEAGEKGGSMDAGLKALKKNKRLFVPEYHDIPESAVGNPILIRNGATPIRRSSMTSSPNVMPILNAIASNVATTLF